MLSLGVFVTWQAVQHWMSGRAALPEWAAKALLDQINADIEKGNALLVELDAYIVERKQKLHHQQGRLNGRPVDD